MLQADSDGGSRPEPRAMMQPESGGGSETAQHPQIRSRSCDRASTPMEQEPSKSSSPPVETRSQIMSRSSDSETRQPVRSVQEPVLLHTSLTQLQRTPPITPTLAEAPVNRTYDPNFPHRPPVASLSTVMNPYSTAYQQPITPDAHLSKCEWVGGDIQESVHSEVEDNTSLARHPKGDLREEIELEDIPPATTLGLQSTKRPLDVGAGDSGNHYEAADQDDIAPPTKRPKPTKKVRIKAESIARSDTDEAAGENDEQGKEQSAQRRKGGQPRGSGRGRGRGRGKGNSSTKVPQEEQEKLAELAPGRGRGRGQGAVRGTSRKGKGKASVDIPEQSEQEEQADQALASKPAPRLTRRSVAVAAAAKAMATSLATSSVRCFDCTFTAGLR